MTHHVVLHNNTDGTLTLNLLSFFTRVEGVQQVSIISGGDHEFDAQCYPPQAVKRLKEWCLTEGLDYGKTGIQAEFTELELAE